MPGSGIGECRVAVADHGDVVHHVEIDAAVGADQVFPPAAFDAGRVLVVVLLNFGERARSPPAQSGAVLGKWRRVL